MVVSSRELPKHVCSNQISTSDMRERDSARILRCFAGSNLAGDAQQGAGREFSGVAPAACILSFRVVWIDRRHG